MSITRNITSEQAMVRAIAFAGINNEEYHCISNHLEGGLYHLIIKTLCMKYEFYIDAVCGDILGIDTEPLPYQDILCLCETAERALSDVA